MKASSTLILVVLAVVLSASLTYQLLNRRYSGHVSDLKRKIARHEHKLDSLRSAAPALRDTLKAAHDTTVIETVRYEKIKPITRSVPYLDSMFRARYH
jgi:hypothetical protein